MLLRLLFASTLVLTALGQFPCYRPLGLNLMGCGGGARYAGYGSGYGGGGQIPHRPFSPYGQAGQYGQSGQYGQTGQYGQFPQPHSGGSYVTPPPTPHPTQSTPTDHATAVSASNSRDELGDIFDEFNGNDEELLRLRNENAISSSSLYLRPLQPPARMAPYRPQISQHNDVLPTSISTSLESSQTAAESERSGFIPQSSLHPSPSSPTISKNVHNTLPAIYTETTTHRNPYPNPLDGSIGTHSTSSPSSIESRPIPYAPVPLPAAGSYVVPPQPAGPFPRPLPPTSPYVRPYPFGPHFPRPLPIGGGGHQPYVGTGVQPAVVPPAPTGGIPHGVQIPPCTAVPQPAYTRIPGGYGVPGSYGYGQSLAGGHSTYGYGGHMTPVTPPFVDCCGKCRSPCRFRAKRQFAAKLFDLDGKTVDIPPAKDGRCTNEELRELMMKTTTSTASLSKRVIQKAAEERFGGFFSVFCSKEDFSYSSRAEFYCQTSKNDVVCFAFKHN